MSVHTQMPSVATIMKLPIEIRDEILASILRAIEAYQETRDPRILEQMVREVENAAWAHESLPGFTEAAVSAPTKPGGVGRSIEEVFSEVVD